MGKNSSRELKLKKDNLKDIDFYFITDSSLSRNGILSDVNNAIDAGCKIIQYREKNKNSQALIDEALKIRMLCKDALFLINDQVDVALAVGADGVHIGHEDMQYKFARELLGREKIIGITVHNEHEAIVAEKAGADYIGLSPIFVTSTKINAGLPCGTQMIGEVRKKTNIPIVAIGGITKQNVADVIISGADSAAAISAVLNSENVGKEVSDFINIIRENKKKR